MRRDVFFHLGLRTTAPRGVENFWTNIKCCWSRMARLPGRDFLDWLEAEIVGRASPRAGPSGSLALPRFACRDHRGPPTPRSSLKKSKKMIELGAGHSAGNGRRVETAGRFRPDGADTEIPCLSDSNVTRLDYWHFSGIFRSLHGLNRPKVCGTSVATPTHQEMLRSAWPNIESRRQGCRRRTSR